MKKKILFLTRLDPKNIKSWSGLNYYMLRLLQKNFDVITVGPLSNRIRYIFLIKKFFFLLFRIKFDIDRSTLVSRNFAKQINKKIKKKKYDIVLTSDTYLLSFFKTKKPVFIWTDFLFSTYYSTYFKSLKIHPDTIKEGNYCEKLALKKAKKIFLTSEWSVKEAIKDYKISRKKFSVIPFGANINPEPKKKKIINNIKNKQLKILKILSVGVSWERKGMDKAINLIDAINRTGQKALLYIIGSKPPKNYNVSKNVSIIRFLDKNKIEDQRLLTKFFLKSHFNVLFSTAEASAVVYSEASAFGLYTITHDVGGGASIIKNNVNGFRFKLTEENVDLIAKYILNIFKNKKKFIRKSIMSRNEYDKRLNWSYSENKFKKSLIH
jgi:glycosyltransferase involved in cell wall biosynthesis